MCPPPLPHSAAGAAPNPAATERSRPQKTDKEILDYRGKRQRETTIRQGKPSRKLVSPTTVNKEVGLLRKLLRLAHAKGLINRVPNFKMEKEPNRERVLEAEEYTALLDNCPTWLRRVCVGAYETSLTRGDLLDLTWDEIERKQGVIKLMGGREKTKVKQEIPILTDELVALIAELEAEYRKLPRVNRLVFTCDGERIKETKLRRALEKACKAAGIKNFTFHDFRHCAITRWAKWGLPLIAAMRMAGHSSVQSHKKYQNLQTRDLVEVFTGCLQRQKEKTGTSVSY